MLIKTSVSIALLFTLALAGVQSSKQLAQAQYALSPTRVFLQPNQHRGHEQENGPYITATSVVRVVNTSNDILRLKAYPENWTMDDHGQVTLADEKDPFNLTGHITINPIEFEVAPGRTQVVRLLISVPKDAPDGEYRDMLFFENLKTDLETEEMKKGVSVAVTLKYRSGCGVYFYKGHVEPKVAISEFTLTPSDNQLKAHFLLSNTGTQHARVQASILLTRPDASGTPQPMGSIPIASQNELLLLPGKTRVMDQILAPSKQVNLLEAGSYDAQLTLAPSETSYQAQIKMEPVTQKQSLKLDQPIKGSL